MARPSKRPAWSTLAAVALIAVVTLGFAVNAVSSMAGLDASGTIASRDATLLGLTGQDERMITTVAAVAMLVVSAITAAQGVGLLLRRDGARHAALLTFGVLGLLALGTAMPGLLATPPAPNAGWGLLTGVADLGVVALLLLPATADDFDLADRRRTRPVPQR